MLFIIAFLVIKVCKFRAAPLKRRRSSPFTLLHDHVDSANCIREVAHCEGTCKPFDLMSMRLEDLVAFRYQLQPGADVSIEFAYGLETPSAPAQLSPPQVPP